MSEQPARRGPGRAPAGTSDGRQDLLRAARQVFAERGYAAARTRDILAKADATAPTLYHHFGNKAGLYIAVVGEVNDEIVGAFSEAIEDRVCFLDRLDGILDATLAFQARDRAFSSLVLAAPVEVRQHPELAVGSASVRRMREFVERMCSTSEGLAVSPRTATQAVMTIIYGLARSAATHSPREFASVVASVRILARAGLVAQRTEVDVAEM